MTIKRKLETAISTILIWVVALAIGFLLISYTRYSWRNDCLTYMQVMKTFKLAMTWEEEKVCPEPKIKKKK